MSLTVGCTEEAWEHTVCAVPTEPAPTWTRRTECAERTSVPDPAQHLTLDASDGWVNLRFRGSWTWAAFSAVQGSPLPDSLPLRVVWGASRTLGHCSDSMARDLWVTGPGGHTFPSHDNRKGQMHDGCPALTSKYPLPQPFCTDLSIRPISTVTFLCLDYSVSFTASLASGFATAHWPQPTPWPHNNFPQTFHSSVFLIKLEPQTNLNQNGQVNS